jgi:hypothetical protein
MRRQRCQSHKKKKEPGFYALALDSWFLTLIMIPDERLHSLVLREP